MINKIQNYQELSGDHVVQLDLLSSNHENRKVHKSTK